jgi:hypothetical protein
MRVEPVHIIDRGNSRSPRAPRCGWWCGGGRSGSLQRIVAVQRSHHPNPRQHRRAVALGNEQERFGRRLPFRRLVLGLRQFSDVERGVAERDQLAPAVQVDRIEKLLVPSQSADTTRIRALLGQRQ